MRTIFNKKVCIILNIVITIILVFLILLRVNINELIRSLLNVKVEYLIITMFLAAMIVFLRIYRWYYLIKREGLIDFSDAFISYIAGLTAAIITPLRIGEFVRVLYIKHKSKIKLIKYVLIDKVFDFFVIVILSILGLSYVNKNFLPLVIILLLITLIFILDIKKISIPFKEKIMNLFNKFGLISKRVIINCLLLTLASFIFYIIQFYILISSFEKVPFVAVFFTVPFIVLSNLLPITIGGIGVREWVSMVIFSFFGVSKIAALNSAFLVFVLNVLIPSIIGLPFVNKIKKKD